MSSLHLFDVATHTPYVLNPQERREIMMHLRECLAEPQAPVKTWRVGVMALPLGLTD